jgi:hypothetical protein
VCARSDFADAPFKSGSFGADQSDVENSLWNRLTWTEQQLALPKNIGVFLNREATYSMPPTATWRCVTFPSPMTTPLMRCWRRYAGVISERTSKSVRAAGKALTSAVVPRASAAARERLGRSRSGHTPTVLVLAEINLVDPSHAAWAPAAKRRSGRGRNNIARSSCRRRDRLFP